MTCSVGRQIVDRSKQSASSRSRRHLEGSSAPNHAACDLCSGDAYFAGHARMTRFAPTDVLHRVAKAETKLAASWHEGVHLERRSGRTLHELRDRVTSDRLALAAELARRGREYADATPSRNRDAISRYYYAAYHAFRAVVYFHSGGDDFEKHSVLPTRIPDDFPAHSIWSNDLKSAREIRNAADYDMYPKSDSAWRGSCLEVQATGEGAVRVARAYLRAKGCTHV